MDFSCMSLVIFQFQELRTTAINELDFFSTVKGQQKCASKYEVCVVQLWCWCVPLSLAAEIHSPQCLSHLCLNTLVLSSFLFFFRLSSASKGWFSLQVLKVIMTSELLCMRCSCTLQSWLALLRSGMLCISSVSTPCPVLVLFFHREECDGRREVSKQKKI